MERILVLRGGALGDFLVTLPAIRAVRERWPQAEVECLGQGRFAELGVGRGYFSAARSLERGSLAGFFVEESVLDPDWIDTFSEFDLVVSWLYDPRDVFHRNLARCGVPEIVRGDPRVPEGFGAPAARHFLAALPWPTEDADPLGRLALTEADRAAAAQFDLEEPFLVLHPGSGSPAKNWPLDRWAALLENLKATGHRSVVVGGEADRAALDRLRPLAPVVLHDRPLPELAAVLARAALFVGHDSGITHLAAAVVTPGIALFGPTDPQVWAPSGATVLAGGEDWSGFSVADVMAAIADSLLDRRP